MVAKSFWNKKRVFVTGATGLVGSQLINKLLDSNAEVHALIFEEPQDSELVRSKNISRIISHHGNLVDRDSVDKAITNSNAEFIFHLGAQTIVSKALLNPEETFLTNIQGTWNVLESTKKYKHNLKSIIIASSDKAYGKPVYLPYTESHPLQGEAPYDVSKSCTDLLAQSYAKTYDLPISISRCGNIYGPGDTNWTRIVPGTFKSILMENSKPILRSNGLYLRDYIFVQDVVDAYLLLAEQYENIVPGSAYNFSNDRAYSVLEIYKEICISAVGRLIEPTILNKAQHEIEDQHLMSQKAQKDLGWKAKFELEEGLVITAKWYKKLFENV